MNTTVLMSAVLSLVFGSIAGWSASQWIQSDTDPLTTVSGRSNADSETQERILKTLTAIERHLGSATASGGPSLGRAEPTSGGLERTELASTTRLLEALESSARKIEASLAQLGTPSVGRTEARPFNEEAVIQALELERERERAGQRTISSSFFADHFMLSPGDVYHRYGTPTNATNGQLEILWTYYSGDSTLHFAFRDGFVQRAWTRE